jgi:hypothetical protein
LDILIGERSINLGGHYLEYDAYYFDADKYAGLTCGQALREILRQWAAALAGLEDGQTLFLPFSLDDEWVECLRVRRRGENIAYQHVWVSENGWALDVSDLSDFMSSAPEVWKESPETVGEVEKAEFISAVLNAKVAAA